MSVSLMRKSRLRAEKSSEVSIATNDLFERYWITASELLELKLVPHLWDPFYPNETERLALVDELRILQSWINTNASADAYYTDVMSHRIDSLTESLGAGTTEEYDYCFG